MNRNKHLIIYGVAAVAVIGGSVFAARALLKPSVGNARAVAAAPHRIRETTKAVGTIVPSQNVDLSFERGGRIARIDVKVGDRVKAGAVLVELENAAEAALVAQARALLEQKRAGASEAEIGIARAAADMAKADAEKAKTDGAASVAAAQAAVDAAQNNLKLAADGEQSRIVSQAYESGIAALQAALPTLDNGLNQSNLVLGVEYITVPAGYDLSALDQSKLLAARDLYATAKTTGRTARDATSTLSATSSHEAIDAAGAAVRDAVTSADSLLSAVFDVLRATPPGDSFTQAMINADETAVQQARTSIAAQAALAVSAGQAIENAKNSLGGYTIAYDKAKRMLSDAEASSASLDRLKDAAYRQALANVDAKTQPPRSVDLAPLQAALASAQAAYEKTRLLSPNDGIVSRQDGKAGAVVVPNMPLVSVLDGKDFQLETYVSETDIAKLAVGDAADVTIDAYGAGAVFPATVVKIDPVVSSANGISGYKTVLRFAAHDDRIKEGMTGNASIVVAEKDALVALPGRSVLQKNGVFVVLVSRGGGRTEERTVAVGARGSDGWVEIVSGLSAGDQAVDFGN